MGYIKHSAIIVTSAFNNFINDAHKQACKLLPGLVTNIVQSRVNNYWSFMIAPDGSKLGWADAEKAARQRGEFVEYVKKISRKHGAGYLETACVIFGGDDNKTKATKYLP